MKTLKICCYLTENGNEVNKILTCRSVKDQVFIIPIHFGADNWFTLVVISNTCVIARHKTMSSLPSYWFLQHTCLLNTYTKYVVCTMKSPGGVCSNVTWVKSQIGDYDLKYSFPAGFGTLLQEVFLSSGAFRICASNVHKDCWHAVAGHQK